MRALYWRDFDCTPESRAIEHPSTIHLHFTNEREACVALLQMRARCADGTGPRYVCIRGPGGLIRGVVR